MSVLRLGLPLSGYVSHRQIDLLTRASLAQSVIDFYRENNGIKKAQCITCSYIYGAKDMHWTLRGYWYCRDCYNELRFIK